MKKLLIVFGSLLLSLAGIKAAPSPSYVTDFVNGTPPQIDALIWTNRGFFQANSLITTAPFETQNTRRFVNLGEMSAYPGFRFEQITDAGFRLPSDEFINTRTIAAPFSQLSALFGTRDTINPYHPLFGGLISINALNITNRGLILGDYAGDIQIKGKNVDLQRSAVGMAALSYSSFFNFDGGLGLLGNTTFLIAAGVTRIQYHPEIGMEDLWWFYSDMRVVYENAFGSDVVDLVTPLGPVASTTVSTPAFFISNENTIAGQEPRTSIGGFGPFGAGFRIFCYTNSIGSTNKVVEVALVRVDDPAIAVDVSWDPSSNPDNPSHTAYIRLTSFSTNVIQRLGEMNQLVLVDTFASEPLNQLLENVFYEFKRQPTNLFAFRALNSDPAQPIGSVTTNAEFFPGIYTQWVSDEFPEPVTMTNRVSTNSYVTWSAAVDSLPSRVPGILAGREGAFRLPTVFNGAQTRGLFGNLATGNYTNFSGRVAIDAENLNLNLARIQGRGTISIRTDNLLGNANAAIEAPILSLDLAAKNDNLVVEKLVKGSAHHFGGSFSMLSVAFSNFWTLTVSNTVPGATMGTDIDLDGDGVSDGCDTNGDGMIDTAGPCPTDPGTTTETTTNYTVAYHVTVVDASFFGERPQILSDVKLRSKATRIVDAMVIDGSFFSDAEDLTIEGILFPVGDDNFDRKQLPNLRNLVIGSAGALQAPGLLTLGNDRPEAIESVTVMTGGLISAASVDTRVARFDQSGEIEADRGQVTVVADVLTSSGGSFTGAFDLSISARDIALTNAILSTGGRVTISATERLVDGGPGSAGMISSSYGVSITSRPPVADMSGTVVETFVPDFQEAEHVWAGADLGATRAGFVNNLALATLSLQTELLPDGTFSDGIFSFLTFRGATGNNAMYVERLEISDEILADLENILNIEPSLTIYYASTSDNVPPEVLDGFITLGGGKLVYIREGGPADENRLVPVRLGDGRTANVPFKLRNSATIDSDNDGIPNGLDLTPFDSVKVSQVKVNAGGNAVEIFWNGLPGSRYEVQASTDFGATPWQTINTLQNSTASPQTLKNDDPLGAGSTARIYRVIITP